MRILTICYEYPPVGGGGATFCQASSEAFVRLGHQVDVVTSGMRDLPTLEERNGVGIHRVRCVRRYRHYSTAVELATQLRPSYRRALALHDRQPYDVCHCHFIVPSGLVAHRLRRTRGLPFVLTAHGSDVPGYNPDRFAALHSLIRPMWRRIVAAAAALTAPSRFLADLLERQVARLVQVIPYGFDPPVAPAGPRGNVVLVAARLVKRKGVQYLLEALREIDTGWEVWVAGDGPYLPTLKRLAVDAGVAARFLGFVSRDELASLYRSAKVFVFPSIQENFPLVLLEAMAAGCAVITTTARGCAEVVGDAALLVEPANVRQLRSALLGLIAYESEITRLGRLAERRVEQFAWRRIGARYEALFQGATR